MHINNGLLAGGGKIYCLLHVLLRFRRDKIDFSIDISNRLSSVLLVTSQPTEHHKITIGNNH